MDGRLLYAIGDVHGRSDLLARLLDAIASDASRGGAEPRVIFLGDIVDRGPDSRGALQMVADTLKRWPTSRLLLGNHDDALLAFFEGRSLGEDGFVTWQGQGGRETLLSYGADPDDPKAARRLLRERYGEHHALLASASVILVGEIFAFVHGGIDPGRRLDAQTRRDCLNIRGRFMNHVGRLDRIVVHGHTPQKPPIAVATENRISMDTGAYASDVLTALVIDRRAGRLETLATTREGGTAYGMPVPKDRGLGTALDLFRALA
ncbi:hypothetical protein ASG43_05515 [Aureimonas sp. Leaf454]|uniref:metallophosphoesterase n=1 Tax=Aureimonas sp. Leaf454 TaxID=1736381 RepID=UPI0006F1D962|nr:metallophosphoesterase [Aureimonas sp. Leaf454]KQT50737.1 hypothetical protein ASG43_05515 [Aureimonas sp. Leaf454]